MGIGIGAKNATVPIYSAEMAPARIRGALVMFWQLWVVAGETCLFTAHPETLADCLLQVSSWDSAPTSLSKTPAPLLGVSNSAQHSSPLSSSSVVSSSAPSPRVGS